MAKPKYEHLLAPLKVRGYVFKNRMIASNSLPHFLQGPEPYPAASVLAHYSNKARGAAEVACMGINNHTIGTQFPMELDFGHFPDYDLYDGNCQNYLAQMADVIHYHGSIAAMSIFQGPPSGYPLMKPLSETPVEQGSVNGDTGDVTKPFDVPKQEGFEVEWLDAHSLPDAYDAETLDKIVRSYAEQARILQSLGFDMISIHMAYRGTLPAKFFSPLTNFRTDELGGSLENRMRFPLRVLQGIRETVGNRMLIEILWSGHDVDGGYTLDDTCAFLNQAKQYIDIVQIRASEADENHPTGFNLEETPFLEDAAYVKANVPGLVVSSVGGYHNPETCDKAIADGKVDMVAMARAWISNPEYGRLVQEGRGEDIVPCLRCNKCHGRGPKDPFVSVCSVNPTIGLEHCIDSLVDPTEGGKRVAVIGGGPAGLRCAIYLADRGHSVTVYEASESLGGMIRHADYAPFKWPLRDYKNYLIAQVGKRNSIQVLLNTPVTPEQVAAENFDVVVAALGAEPARPPIAGLDSVKVWYAADAFIHSDELGQNVVVIGGGEVGTEAGLLLAQKGRTATVVEMRDQLAADSTLIHYRSMFRDAWEAEPTFHSVCNATVTAVSPEGVTYRDADGQEHTLPADSIVVSAGMRAKTDEALAFYGAAPVFYMIGDCQRAATVLECNRAAFAVAHKI